MQKGDAMHWTVEFIEAAVGAEGFEEFSSEFLSFLTDVTRTTAAFLYVSDPRLRSSHFAAHGLSAGESSALDEVCPDWFEEVSDVLEEANVTLTAGDADTEIVQTSRLQTARPPASVAVMGVARVDHNVAGL